MANRSKRRAILPWLPVALLTLAACGDDQPPPKASRPDAGGGERDAGRPDADVEDAGMEPDTGSPDDGLSGNCAIDSNKIFEIARRPEPFLGMSLAVDPIQSTFGLPYVGLQGGCLDVVNLTLLRGGSQSGDPTTRVAIDTCALVKDTAAAAVQGRWLLATVDNRMPPFDVWVQPYDPAAEEQAAAVRLSSNGASGALAISALRGGGALVAWSQESAQGNALYVRALDGDGNPTADAVRVDESPELVYRGLSLAPLGASGAALAYVRFSADFATSEILFRALDASGQPARDPWVLAANAGPSPSVDVATDLLVGGIVYSRAESTEGRQIWFQRIDDTGQAAELLSGPGRSPALRVVNSPNRGVDVSLAKLRAGYVLVYRALPSPTEPRAVLRLSFLDRNGAVIGDSDVSYTSESGGRTGVEAANDGRAVVGWSQVNGDGSSELNLVRVPCLGG